MEIRKGNTILNVDKPLNENQKRFVETTACFTELILGLDEVFMDMAMIQISAMTQTIKDRKFSKEN